MVDSVKAFLQAGDFEAAGGRLYTKVVDPVSRNWENEFAEVGGDEFESEFKEIRREINKIKAIPDWAAVETTIKAVLESRVDDWRSGFIPLFEGLFNDWAEAWAVELGVDFALTKPFLDEWVENYAFQFIERHQGVSLQSLRNVIGIARDEGLDTLGLMDRLQGIYSGWSVLRAEMIARTETIRGENAASVAAYDVAGVKQLQWFTSEDDRVCPFCNRLHGEVYTIHDSLFRQGDVMRVEGGILRLDYEDVKHPPLHVFCRCTVLPVLKSIATPTETPTTRPVRTGADMRQSLEGQAVTDKKRENELRAASRLEADAIKSKRGAMKDLIERSLDPALTDQEFEALKEERARVREEINHHFEAMEGIGKQLRNFKKRRVNRERKLLSVDKPIQIDYNLYLSVTDWSIDHPLDADKDKTFQSRVKRGVNEFAKLIGRNDLLNTAIVYNDKPGRAYQAGGDVFIYKTNKQDPISVLVHELGHVIEEKIPEYHEVAIEFFEKRTQGETPQKMSDLTGNPNYNSYEIAMKDDFIHPYMGKIYKDQNGEYYGSEIISMGLEYMWRDPSDFAQRDPDYFDFIFELVQEQVPNE